MKSRPSERVKMPPGFWTGISRLGIAATDVARMAQLPVTITTEATVTTAQYFAIWQAYSELAGDLAPGITRLAAAFDTAQYPPAVLATYHARDYRDALHRMVRYKQMCPPESLRMTEENGQCTIELEWGDTGQPGPPVLAGITLAFLLELGRKGTGRPLQAQAAEFVHSMGDEQVLEAYFGCAIQTGGKYNRLTLLSSQLDLPFVSYNEELLEILAPALDRSLDEQLGSFSVSGRVRVIIAHSLAGGSPDLQTVAKELAMSGRTLQRRLTGENTTFKQLLTQVRHEQARRYLANPSLELNEVAYLIGYDDQNSFFRGFRHWEGVTPSQWRAEHLNS
ncbi:helix-turn-helix domain-containing protein [Paenibacillus sp. FSL H8-0332]|uniref:helix-turn-helix domain-containing protein n=1 Tax=Paenibacillus sp. FSL H8-0332 TaxID=2954742 RepID=UPI0030D2E6B0